ncbi:MAG: ABC transporter permease [Fimbriimonadaceae bacterium]|nr:ABC transporter permease [Fimbriimonadaceae bacterium]QYK57000.1 MAG: ABC transporter permease [Fimbriimonadaceae bacterium]
MTLSDSFESALRAISANKLRSALTMLGVVIGVGSVIAMIGIGEGTKQKSLAELEITGANRISVMPNRGRARDVGSASTLRTEDVTRLQKSVPLIKYITGVVSSRFSGQTVVKFGSSNARTSVTGAEPQIRFIENANKMHSGQWYDEMDEAMANRKAVLGYTVYDNLFAGDNAIGATIKVNNQNFEVVGVVDYKGGSGWNNPDDQVYIPLHTAQTRLLDSKDRVNYITMQISRSDLLPLAQGQVEDTLYATRRSATGEELFRVFNQAEALQTIETQSTLLSLLLAGIASVSLLVGGIGIMNIMLVSVTERTKEIGLRKAIGAQKNTILTQFLLESVVMCVLGGTIGIILGAVAVQFVAKALQVPQVINLTAVGMAFAFSSIVGVFFGLYPAIRASNLQPIEALRHE